MIPPLPPAIQAPAAVAVAASPLRAQYAWGYVGADGEGKGTLSLLLDAASGRVVLELHGAGERLLLLSGDGVAGYHLLIPRRQVDARASSLKELPLPFLPAIGSPAALCDLVMHGVGPGVTVTRRDASAPLKLRYQGKDDEGKEVQVWLHRKVWKP